MRARIEFAVRLGLLATLLAGPSALTLAGQSKSSKSRSAQAPEKVEAPVPAEVTANGPAAPVDPTSYIIGPEDVLAIQVWREPEVSRLVQVRPDGRITLPLAGELQAGGLTPAQLQETVSKKLSETMNQPLVTVSVQSVQSKKYYLVGEVNRSGAFPLVVPTTVLEALNAAGGFREFANKGKITILRGSQRLRFNYKDVVKGKNLKQNIYVENGDHIIVQ